MFNKYIKYNFIFAVISFIIEVVSISFIFNDIALHSELQYVWAIIVFILTWVLSAAYGGWIQWIGAKYHDAESYTITAGLGMQIPLTQFITIYFTYRFSKENQKEK